MSFDYSRYLGRIESSLAPPYISNVVVPVSLSLKKEINIKILREAVFHVAKNQPNLCNGIAKVEGTYQFVPADPTYDYFQVLPASTDWKEVCRKYSNQCLHEDATNQPSLKIFYVPSRDEKVYLIVVVLHCTADGVNGRTIVNDILTTYEGLVYGTLNYPRVPNPPPVEEMMLSGFFPDGHNTDERQMNYDATRSKFIKHCLQMFQKFNYSLPFFEDDHVGPVISNKFYVSSTEVYNNFISICKEKKVTVGTVFIAIKYFAYSCFAFQEKKNDLEELFIGCNVPFNLRKRVALDIPENCVNMSALQNFITPGIKRKTKLWEFVETVRDELVYIQKNKFYLFDYVYVDEIAKHDLVVDYLKKNGVFVQMFVSNMRKYGHDCEYKDFLLNSVHCVGGLFLPDWDHLELYIFSTDKFNLSYVHRDGGINGKIAEYVFSLVVHLAENLLQLEKNFALENLIDKFPIPTL